MRRVPASPSPGKRRRIVIAQKRYAVVTQKGVEFVRKRYSCSVPLAQEEIKLYGFLMRLISFGGMLPLSSIKRWSLMECLTNTVKRDYTKVTSSRLELPKEEVQEIIREIWGEIPKGYCV